MARQRVRALSGGVAHTDDKSIAGQVPDSELVRVQIRPQHLNVGQIEFHDRIGRDVGYRESLARDGPGILHAGVTEFLRLLSQGASEFVDGSKGRYASFLDFEVRVFPAAARRV